MYQDKLCPGEELAVKAKENLNNEKMYECKLDVLVYGMKIIFDAKDLIPEDYRKLGYKDCGGFTVDIPGYEQPMEMIMNKAL